MKIRYKEEKTLTFAAAIILLLIGVALSAAFDGCALAGINTKDPCVIANAVYLDALSTYNDLAEAYIPIRPVLEKENPDLANKIHDMFAKYNDMLIKWKTYSQICDVTSMDRGELRAYIRSIMEYVEPVEYRKGM